MLKICRKQIFVTLVAVLSMFVSAVSACACSHHEPAKATVEMSCHGTSHETTETPVKAEKRSDSVDANCNCFVRTPTPAIFAKTSDKRSSIENQIAEPDTNVSLEPLLTPVRGLPSAVFESAASIYKKDLLSSLPSRAPPRL